MRLMRTVLWQRVPVCRGTEDTPSVNSSWALGDSTLDQDAPFALGDFECSLEKLGVLGQLRQAGE